LSHPPKPPQGSELGTVETKYRTIFALQNLPMLLKDSSDEGRLQQSSVSSRSRAIRAAASSSTSSTGNTGHQWGLRVTKFSAIQTYSCAENQRGELLNDLRQRLVERSGSEAIDLELPSPAELGPSAELMDTLPRA